MSKLEVINTKIKTLLLFLFASEFSVDSVFVPVLSGMDTWRHNDRAF